MAVNIKTISSFSSRRRGKILENKKKKSAEDGNGKGNRFFFFSPFSGRRQEFICTYISSEWHTVIGICHNVAATAKHNAQMLNTFLHSAYSTEQ